MYMEEGGKLYFGPFWDCDICLGRNDYSEIELEGYDIEHNRCIDGELMKRIFADDEELVYYLHTLKWPVRDMFGQLPPLPNKEKKVKLSNNEEVSGDGMVLAVKYFKKNNIHFDVVLDEGGAITSKMIPGVNQKSAVVAVHEKSRHIFVCKVKQNQEGHGGLNPTKDNVIVRMSNFISEVTKTKIYKAKF